MEKKKEYVAPAILEEVVLETQGPLLAASHVNEPIENDVEVVTMGQDVENGGSWTEHTW